MKVYCKMKTIGPKESCIRCKSAEKLERTHVIPKLYKGHNNVRGFEMAGVVIMLCHRCGDLWRSTLEELRKTTKGSESVLDITQKILQLCDDAGIRTLELREQAVRK